MDSMVHAMRVLRGGADAPPRQQSYGTPQCAYSACSGADTLLTVMDVFVKARPFRHSCSPLFFHAKLSRTDLELWRAAPRSHSSNGLAKRWSGAPPIQMRRLWILWGSWPISTYSLKKAPGALISSTSL